MTTTTASAAQALETVCDECAGDGQLAYDPEALVALAARDVKQLCEPVAQSHRARRVTEWPR